ncbi:MAG TPA: hypothetical protein VJ036_01945 [bacterium]|nr:hypothetical protein [bacterium]
MSSTLEQFHRDYEPLVAERLLAGKKTGVCTTRIYRTCRLIATALDERLQQIGAVERVPCRKLSLSGLEAIIRRSKKIATKWGRGDIATLILSTTRGNFPLQEDPMGEEKI